MPALLDEYIFTGVTGNAAWAAIKTAWEVATKKSWEQIYLDAFPKALAASKEQPRKYTDGAEPLLNGAALQRAITRAAASPLADHALTELTGDALVKHLGAVMAEERVIEFEGNNLAEEGYAQVVRNLVRSAHAVFWDGVVKNETAFRNGVFLEFQANRAQLQDIKDALSKLSLLKALDEKQDYQTRLLERQSLSMDEIKGIVLRIEERLARKSFDRELDEVLPPAKREPAGAPKFEADFVHAYPLQANFTGRKTERQALLDVKYDVFVSYSHKDKEWVHGRLLPGLERSGLKVCLDFRDFELGVSAAINMERAVQQSRKTILVLTPNWVESEWTEFESLLIQTKDPAGRRQRMLPVMLEECSLPDRLSILTYADFRNEQDWEFQLERVLRTLCVERTTAPPSDKLPVVQPIIQPDFVHPYPLQANFTGRKKERGALTTWFVQREQPVYAVVAIGGMGKSAVTWVWVLQDLLGLRTFTKEACAVEQENRPEGVLWWSFYDSKARFASFLDRALEYASGGAVDPRGIPSEHDKADKLIDLLEKRDILLVLDGFERELRAYASLNAPYMGDGEERHEVTEQRVCVDPHAAYFLQWAASLPLRGRILMTTRLMPRDLEGNDGNPLDGCANNELKGFDPADVAAFFRAEGIKGMPSEIKAACAPYAYHPLAVRLLAGAIIRDKRKPRDIETAKRHVVTAELKGKDKHHILQVAYDELAAKRRKILSQIAAFRNPMTFETLAAVLPVSGAHELEVILDELVERGLLLCNDGLYDLHPVVRQYAYERLTDKEGVHTRLRDHFSAVPMPQDTEKVKCIENLDPVIELYHHTVRAGQFDEACDVFYVRLQDVLYYRFGAYDRCIELLCALFPEGEPLVKDGQAKVPRLTKESDQAWALNALACCCSASGQPRRALPLFELQNKLRDDAKDEMNLAIGLENLACMAQLHLGQLGAAEENLRRSIALSREIRDALGVADACQNLGLLLACLGGFGESETELDAAVRGFKEQEKTQGEGIVECSRALRAIIMGDAQAALAAARHALELWHKTARERFRYERDRVRVEWLVGWALTALAEERPGDVASLLAEAEQHLTEALTRCRNINMVDHEPDILLAWARWHFAKGDAVRASQWAAEALFIADRCEYRLKQADIHNFLARLALDAGDKAAARSEAGIAKERAWCDGPPHCYKPALDEAERLLKEIG